MRLLAGFALLLSVVFVASCRERSVAQSGVVQKSMHSETEKLSRVQSEAGLVFPTNATLVQFAQPDVAVDPVWVAKVVIPPSSYEPFAQVLVRKPADNTVYDGALANSTSWWTPTNVVMTKKYLANSQTFVNVVVSKESDGFAVYIECAVF